jgi:hypothetical protein
MLFAVLPYSRYVLNTIRRIQRHIDDNVFHCRIPANFSNYQYTSRRSSWPAAESGLVAGQDVLIH